MEQHVCVVCGHVHDEATEGLWDELDASFLCPECGCGKEEYETVTVQQYGTVEKQVYSADLKSAGASHGGSTPPSPTINIQLDI